jgi:hypothetical protein
MHPVGPRGALAEVPPTVPGASFLSVLIIMKKSLPPQFDEPVGIVISRGREPETTPRFSAYVWAPYPDDELEKKTQPV